MKRARFVQEIWIARVACSALDPPPPTERCNRVAGVAIMPSAFLWRTQSLNQPLQVFWQNLLASPNWRPTLQPRCIFVVVGRTLSLRGCLRLRILPPLTRATTRRLEVSRSIFLRYFKAFMVFSIVLVYCWSFARSEYGFWAVAACVHVLKFRCGGCFYHMDFLLHFPFAFVVR